MSSKIYKIDKDKPKSSLKGMAWQKDGSKKGFKKCKGVCTFKNASKKGFKKGVCIFWNSFSIYKMRRMDFSPLLL